MYYFPKITVDRGMCAEKMAYSKYKVTTKQNVPNLAGIPYSLQLNTHGKKKKKAHPHLKILLPPKLQTIQ